MPDPKPKLPPNHSWRNQYLVWSNEHKAWWGHNRHGYVPDIRGAGIYYRDEALSIVERATVASKWRRPPNEIPVRIEDLPEDAQAAVYERFK